MVDFQALGTGIGGLILGAGGVAMWWRQQKVENAAATAEKSVIDMLREEVGRLSERVTRMERRESRILRHVYRLEGVLRANGLEPPTFDPDADEPPPLPAGAQ